MKPYILPIIVICSLLAGCSTTVTDANGKPSDKGGYVTKRIVGIPYSRKPQPTMLQDTQQKMIRFLLISAAFGFAITLAGAVLGYLHKTGKFPCGWWDEILVGGLIVICISLLGILFLAMLKWIILSGLAGLLGYKGVKGIRNRKKVRGAL